MDPGGCAPALAPVRPAYGEGSLAELLPGLLTALGVPGDGDRLAPGPLPDLAEALAGVRRVALLLVDGLGYQQLPAAAPASPLLAEALAGRLGRLQVLTAAFPSTTPTGLTTLGTGAPPGAHGLVGFSVNLPGTGRVVNHLDWRTDPDPLRWQPLATQATRAAAAGVAVRMAARGEFAGSGLTVAGWRGVGYLPADDPDALASQLLGALTAVEPPALVYGYHPDVDRRGHEYGVGSPPWHAAVAELDRLLTRLVDGLPGDAALVVTADHGQLDIPADQRFDVGTDPRLSNGLRLVAGEPRVRFLHPLPGAAADVQSAWQAVLGPAAWVATREEVVADGWFGPVSGAHLRRVGELVAVCRDRYAVLATGAEPPGVSRLVAFHGSCTAAEMQVPLLVLRSG